MNTKYQLLCARSIYPMLILFAGGLVGLARFVPAPSPNLSATDIAAIYQAHPYMIMIGMLFVMMAASLFVPFFTAISFQMARIEGPQPILAVTQGVVGGGTALVTIIPCMIFATAAFRPDRDPNLTLLLNDFGWLFFLWAVTLPVLQNLAITICVFSDKSPNPLFPRWVGYYNILDIVGTMCGALIPLYKTGPLAWDGALGFYVPMNTYFIWLISMAIVTIRAIKRTDLTASQEKRSPQMVHA